VAAAALVALAAVVPLTGLLSNSSSATTAVFEATLTTTTIASTDRADLPAGADMTTLATAGGAAPAAESTTEAALGAAGGDVDQTQFTDAFDKSYATTAATVPADETTPCRDDAATALESADLYTLSIADESGEEVVVLFTVGPDGSVAAIGYSPADCSVVFTEP
jgi:hypothetical protein